MLHTTGPNMASDRCGKRGRRRWDSTRRSATCSVGGPRKAAKSMSGPQGSLPCPHLVGEVAALHLYRVFLVKKGWAQAAASAGVDRLRYFARNGPVDKDVQSTGSSSSPVLVRSSSSSSSSSSTSSQPYGGGGGGGGGGPGGRRLLQVTTSPSATRRDTGASIGLLAVDFESMSDLPPPTSYHGVCAGRRRLRDPGCRETEDENK